MTFFLDFHLDIPHSPSPPPPYKAVMFARIRAIACSSWLFCWPVGGNAGAAGSRG